MKKIVPSVTAVVAALLLVLAYDAVTYAGTGKSLILGKLNKSSAVTTLARTSSGPALSLKTKSGAPLAVSSSTKVAKLNADQVDGMDASKLRTVVTSWTIPDTGGYVTSFQAVLAGGVPPGNYLATYSVGGDSGGAVECTIRKTTPPATVQSLAYASGVRGDDGDFGVSATAPVTVTADDTFSILCSAVTDMFRTTPSAKPSSVTFVPVNGITKKTATMP